VKDTNCAIFLTEVWDFLIFEAMSAKHDAGGLSMDVGE
jgi:hypothetical protein